jgi:hypothetical protein
MRRFDSPQVVLFALSMTALSLLLSGCRGSAPAPQAGASEAGTVAVEVATVQTGDLSEEIEVTGDLASYAGHRRRHQAGRSNRGGTRAGGRPTSRRGRSSPAQTSPICVCSCAKRRQRCKQRRRT